jgi:hypothetical protein
MSQELEQIATASLIPYARNSRTHSDEQVAQIMASIREFGFTNPVLIDEAGTIIAGHGRVLAATRMELSHVPCLRLTHLTESQKRAYVIADNQLALNSSWDSEMLSVELSDLHADDFDLGLLGFDPDELESMLGLDVGKVNAEEEWQGMPEFEQDEVDEFKSMIIHFPTEADFWKFAKLIGQTLTVLTKSISYPKQEAADLKSLSMQDTASEP